MLFFFAAIFFFHFAADFATKYPAIPGVFCDTGLWSVSFFDFRKGY